MKKYFLLTALVVLALNIRAQESIGSRSHNANTLLKEGGRPTGGFFAMQPKLTYLADQVAFMPGASMAMVLGHQFNIGLAGYVLMSDVNVNYFSFNSPFAAYQGYLEFAYAGICLIRYSSIRV